MMAADHDKVIPERVTEQLICRAVFEAQLDLGAAEIWFIARPEDLSFGEPEALHPITADAHDGHGAEIEVTAHADAPVRLVVGVEPEI